MPSESWNKFVCNTIPQLDRFVKGGTCQPLPIRTEVDTDYELQKAKPMTKSFLSTAIHKEFGLVKQRHDTKRVRTQRIPNVFSVFNGSELNAYTSRNARTFPGAVKTTYLLMTSHASFGLFTHCWFPEKHCKIIETRN
uniref:Uncharacterized protein n=1 Tax=Oryza brachyantha TaxID=4533 RepID=J3MRM2_ORYBR